MKEWIANWIKDNPTLGIAAAFAAYEAWSGHKADKALASYNEDLFKLQKNQLVEQERQRRQKIKERGDVANMREWGKNIGTATGAAEAGLSNIAMLESQAMADQYGRRRADITDQFFGPGGGRDAELKRLRDIREADMRSAAMPVTNQFSGAGVPGTPSSWANAYNIRASQLGTDVGERAGLMADLSSAVQDTGMQSFKGARDLTATDMEAKSMADAFKIDTGVGEQALTDTVRKATGEEAVAEADIAHGYNIPEKLFGPVDSTKLRKATAAADRAKMFGDIAGSITKTA